MNSSWMFAEYCLKIISAIFVTIYIARYLGPEDFGVLSYALAVVTIFMAVTRLGMESILVRELARHTEQAKDNMGTAFMLMLVAAFIGLLVLSILIYLFESDPHTKIYIWIISTGLVFQSFLVVDYGFQAQVKAKYSSVAKSVAIGISSLIKVSFVWMQADLLLFAIAYALEYAIVGLLLVITHFVKKQPRFLFLFQKDLAKFFLKSAWPMVLSAVSAMLYMRIDQIMIKNMLDVHQLGLYAAATKIYEGWTIVPYVLSISLLPAIVKLKASSPISYETNLTKLFSLLFWLGIIVATITTLGGEWIIGVSFGAEFIEAKSVLAIVMWTAAFTALGTVSARYFTVEGMEKKIAIRTVFALIINVIINIILIPIYGIEGAAVATLITIFITNYLFNYVDKELKQLVNICNNAILLRFSRRS